MDLVYFCGVTNLFALCDAAQACAFLLWARIPLIPWALRCDWFFWVVFLMNGSPFPFLGADDYSLMAVFEILLAQKSEKSD